MPDDSFSDTAEDETTVSRDSDRGRKLAEDAELAREFARYASTDAIPWIMLSDDAIRARRLDPRASLLLSHVDGRRNVAAIVKLTGLPGAEALGVFVDLVKRGVVAFR